jgi:hypothetical protein
MGPRAGTPLNLVSHVQMIRDDPETDERIRSRPTVDAQSSRSRAFQDYVDHAPAVGVHAVWSPTSSKGPEVAQPQPSRRIFD